MRKLTPLALAIAGSLLTSPFSYAQQETAKEEQKVERIEVTGSRIKGVDLEGTQPLVVISAEDIRNSGASTIYDLLKDVGQLRGGSGTFDTTESGTGSNDTPAGQAAASLRGLGPSSTLTLINGRRIAASSFAAGTENFVDINSIPINAIERVEILATGASAIYGADAVAGVINYVLKKDYSGAELNASYGNSTASSNEGKTNVNFIYGTDIAGGNLTVFADYFERKAFAYADRDITKNALNVFYTGQYPSVSFRSAEDGFGFADPACPAELVWRDSFDDDLCGYNPNSQIQIRPEMEAASAGFIFNKEIGNTNFFTDFFISRSKSTAQSSPAIMANLDDSTSRMFTSIDNPGIQANSQLLSLLRDDISSVRFRARFIDPRKVENTTDALRLVTGVTGTVADFEWEAAALYSRSESDQQALSGIYNRYKFNAALFGELCADGSTDCAPDAGGLWYNPFSGQLDNAQALAIIEEFPTRKGKSELLGVDLRLTGDLFDLPSGPVAAAFGIEARQEKISDTPSDNAKARFDRGYIVDVIGFGSSQSSAKRNQFAAYAEFFAPVSDTIDLQLAGRFDHFDDFGSTFNPKVGLTWRPINELVLRASWATSFRAPSLTQAGTELRTTSTTARCLSEYAAIFCGNNAGGEITPNTLELGNANLKAEESESVNLGFAWSPSDTATFTVDYWQFDHKKTIGTDLESMFLRSLTDNSVRFCGLVPADQVGLSFDNWFCDDMGLESGFNGDLAALVADYREFAGSDPILGRDHILLLENTGNQKTRGVDLTYTHRFNTDFGRLTFSADFTRLISFEKERTLFSGTEQLADSFRYPQNLGSLKLRWSGDRAFGSVGLSYTSDYQDEIRLLDQIDQDFITEVLAVSLDRRVPSWTKVNANFGYDFSDNFTISVNIDNLLDKDPPFVFGRSKNVDFINHDALGRNYRVLASYRF
ncbi:hypothetical protein VT06_09020 [Arsukibacterium sp. MJ3]|uniref:TonB-dependent receptor domain-containing protein n=1 Tax=Arsukibacterium sp. MJ3 TaxID=1632859 RepID=UPI0006271CC5|nr:TonB-dependent receptor [Arsukibacterium sp. MJ3]KKO48880.1 hypothetical protein VT06_09020 [Arsukibacterium sp. MJ3]